ncbi:hypothetical protein [Kutzneria sp. CA-103260]|uniref:hypothetical protein n=1 Tax=Kutzneria sp. CA-103260 TaxID=2802641 RepID=UPI001BA9F5CA|nr:hypothetical protein [Kutzneria sp. CA-103260]QUQ69697.1 hypothetical protein JJ691_74580 [Kutzneria sp. CA-103260]
MAGEFGPDGTHALPPLPVYPDTLSGLVAGAPLDAVSYEDVPDTVVPPPPPPPVPDQQRVRAAAQRELARDRARRAAQPVQPTPLPPAPGLQYTRSAPTVGLPAAGGLPPAPSAVQQAQRKNAAAGCIGCAVVLVFAVIVLAVLVVALGSQP